MSIRYNDKGKFFTNVITKDTVPAIMQTLVTRVRGNLHVRVNERVRDELNREEQFLAVTDAVIYDLKGQRLYETDFVLVNRDHVIWIIPDDENTTYRQQQNEESA